MLKLPSIDVLDRAGRPLLRLVGMAILAGIGLLILVAMAQWAVFLKPLPPLPGETLLLLLIPQVPQVVDQITRSAERRSVIHAEAQALNPQVGRV